MFELHAAGKEMEVGIVSFKNLKSGFLPFVFKDNIEKTETSIITTEILEEYTTQIVILLNEIFNPDIPFTEKIV